MYFYLFHQVKESKILEMRPLHNGDIRMTSAEDKSLCIEKMNYNPFQNNITTVKPVCLFFNQSNIIMYVYI